MAGLDIDVRKFPIGSIEGAARMVYAACADPSRQQGGAFEVFAFARIEGQVAMVTLDEMIEEVLNERAPLDVEAVKPDSESEVTEYIDDVLDDEGYAHVFFVREGLVACVPRVASLSPIKASA